jgi:hypothetical protein
MQNLGLVLLVFAFVIMCVATVISSTGRWNLLAVALAFYIAAELFGGIAHSGLLGH